MVGRESTGIPRIVARRIISSRDHLTYLYVCSVIRARALARESAGGVRFPALEVPQQTGGDRLRRGRRAFLCGLVCGVLVGVYAAVLAECVVELTRSLWQPR